MEKISLEILGKAVQEYQNDGKELMRQLGEKFNLELAIPEQYLELISKNNKKIPRKGELTRRWNYSFHGGECGFYNRKHRLRVEVVLSNQPNFGQIDEWFLMKYLEDKKEYKNEVENMEWSELKPMMQKLYDNGIIKKIER